MAELSSLAGEGGLGINVSSIISSIGSFATGVAIFVIIAIITSIITFYIIRKKAFHKHIVIFEEINGVPVRRGQDKAREIALPNTSVKAFLLKSYKIYLPRPTIASGKDEYWFFIRKDGEWINFRMGNLNEEMTKLNVHYDHSDMRLENAAIKKLVESNYKKLNWLKEYAPYIAIGILIIMLGITFFLLFNKASGIASQFSGVAGQLNQAVAEMGQLLESIDNIRSGSGVRAVT